MEEDFLVFLTHGNHNANRFIAKHLQENDLIILGLVFPTHLVTIETISQYSNLAIFNLHI